MEKKLTTGSVWKNIVEFSLPYLLSYFLQTLYGMADLFIIGQYEGVAGTTAVSIGSQVMHMLTVMIVGLAMGTTVSVGQAVGGGDRKKAAGCVGNTAVLFLGLSVILTALLLVCVRPIVAVMSTPQAAVEGTVRYLTICFLGIPFITAYNVISSVFRGMGDSKSPMIFIAVACAVNIGLDILFMGLLRLGPAGAALGTTLSQAVSVAVSFGMMKKQKNGLSLQKDDFRPQKPVMKKLLSIGVPIALQDRLIQIAFIYRHCQPARPDGCGGGGHCGKGDRLSVSGALVHAVHGVGAGSAEYRRGQAGAGRADPLVCHGHCGGLRPDRLFVDAVVRRAGGGAVYLRRSGHCGGRPLSARLYLGLHFCRDPFLLQRLFLRRGKIGPFVSA